MPSSSFQGGLASELSESLKEAKAQEKARQQELKKRKAEEEKRVIEDLARAQHEEDMAGVAAPKGKTGNKKGRGKNPLASVDVNVATARESLAKTQYISAPK
jgi:hypothetical protein